MSQQHIFLTNKQQETPTITDAVFNGTDGAIYQCYHAHINHYSHFAANTALGRRLAIYNLLELNVGNVIAIFRLKYLKPKTHDLQPKLSN